MAKDSFILFDYGFTLFLDRFKSIRVS